jgi:hypothetical protein
MLPVLAAANPGIAVIPDQYDFGEVEVGASASTTIEISNAWWGNLSIASVTIDQGGSDFALVNVPPPGTIVSPGSSLFFGVEFNPKDEGPITGTIVVQWTNGEAGISYVELSGTGLPVSGPLTIEDILAFFDAGVEAGTIQGKGPACSRNAHLKVFKFKLLMVAFFIDKGWDKGACQLLWHAYERSDGQDCPKDWIKNGPGSNDVDELNAMILQLLSDMGCL